MRTEHLLEAASGVGLEDDEGVVFAREEAIKFEVGSEIDPAISLGVDSA